MGLIKKAYELQFQPKLKALIYGQAGAGKTTLALSAPKPLLVDCDGGVHRVNYGHLAVADTVQVQSYNDVLDLFNEDLTPYETIIFDTGGKLLDFMAPYIIKNNPKMGKRNGVLTLQGYGERKQEFSALCKKLNQLNKHVIFVAHQKTIEENDANRYVPLFGGSNYDDLVTELDLVGYVNTIGKNRTITFNPTDRNDGKNTCNLPDEIKLPIVVDAEGNALENTFFSKVIDTYTQRIKNNQLEGVKYNELIASFSTKIDDVVDAEGLNKTLDEIKNAEHIGSSEIKLKRMLFDKSKQLNIQFSTEQNKFVA